MVGNIKVATTATANVPSKKTMRSILSLISTSLLHQMSTLVFMLFLQMQLEPTPTLVDSRPSTDMYIDKISNKE